jgi:hypothetical protein
MIPGNFEREAEGFCYEDRFVHIGSFCGGVYQQMIDSYNF